MKLVVISILWIFSFHLYSQNLIPNASFETQIRLDSAIYSPTYWISPSQGSPDYFTPSNGYGYGSPLNIVGFQEGSDSSSYMGLGIYPLYTNNSLKRAREYIQNRLIKKLELDSVYCLRLYVSLADSSHFASRGMLGVYFSNNRISSNDFFHLPYSPQIIVSTEDYIEDKENWIQYDFRYVANGGEEYITIGNFNDSNLIDTIYVGGGNEIFYQNTYYYLDNFFLGSCDSLPEDTSIGLRENILHSKLDLYPNPLENRLIVDYRGNGNLIIVMYDLVGQQIEISPSLISNSKYEIDVGNLPRGLYFLNISDGVNRISKKIVKN